MHYKTKKALVQENQTILSDFTIQRPKLSIKQEDSLTWLLNAHVRAEQTKNSPGKEELSSFKEKLKEKLYHVACKSHQVSERGHDLEDFLFDEYEKMPIYSLHENPSGKSITDRTKKYKEVVDNVFRRFYEKDTEGPDDIIHVSCTGYVAPSGAQMLVSEKNWDTTVTHAYHMGCYASVPAVRMANGFLASSAKSQYAVDVVHTEVCSLHTNPSLHKVDQLVSQSLFADGYIRYRIKNQTYHKAPHFKLLASKEYIVPDSTDKMSWMVNDWGFELYIAKEIPVLIARNLKPYLEALCAKGNLSTDILKTALFAVHPGGPKILDHIKALLDLKDDQIQYSYEILYKYGNMSSATLPHVWEKILEKEQGSPYVISLAFGPGLSICGLILKMEK